MFHVKHFHIENFESVIFWAPVSGTGSLHRNFLSTSTWVYFPERPCNPELDSRAASSNVFAGNPCHNRLRLEWYHEHLLLILSIGYLLLLKFLHHP
jgi:hypothetical protein